MILFVGDKPSPKMKPGARPFEGAACEARFVSWAEYLGQYYYTVNSVSQNDILMLNLWITLGYPIVALGNNASKRLNTAPHFKLPHPSGRNRQINDKSYIEARLAECKKYIEGFAKV